MLIAVSAVSVSGMRRGFRDMISKIPAASESSPPALRPRRLSDSGAQVTVLRQSPTVATGLCHLGGHEHNKHFEFYR
jgi:hypothetical protein